MKIFITSLRILLFMTLLTGGIYPLIVTVIGQSLLVDKANGSLIRKDGRVIGSELIGQNFLDPKYFWSRPSATDYNPLPSGGSNLGLTSKDLQAKFKERSEKYKNGGKQIPADLLFASASGLDPHITAEAARFQISRVVSERHLSSEQQDKLYKLINDLDEKPDYTLFGERRVNVVKLNLALDQNF